jgi:hypothetical protein
MQDWSENFLCCSRHTTLKKLKRDEIIVQTHWLVNNVCKESLNLFHINPVATSGIVNASSGQYTLSRPCFHANSPPAPPPHLHGRSGCMFCVRGCVCAGSHTYGLPPKHFYA